MLVAAASVAVWAALGLNTGWTKNSIIRWEVDPVTEIRAPVIEERFIPGIDFLAGAFAIAAFLFAASFSFKSKKITKLTNENESTHT